MAEAREAQGSSWRRISFGLASLCAAAVLYRFPPAQYKFYPVCPIHALTGLLCPGCGATRALAALLHGDLRLAVEENGLFVLLLPLAMIYAGKGLLRQPGRFPRVPGMVVWGLLGVAGFFTVYRNLI